MSVVAGLVAGVLASVYVLWLTRTGRRGPVASPGPAAQPAPGGADAEEPTRHCVLCGAPLPADADDLLSRTAPVRPAPRSGATEARQ